MPAQTADAPFDDTGRPSKTQLKQQSHDLQALGEALVEMPESRLASIELPERLRDAIHEFRRTRSHEGRRRQMQYIGKVMRTADDTPLREAVAEYKLGGARDTLKLHEAERWRTVLLEDDEALTRWVQEHPDTDVQRLRSLLRTAKLEQRPDAGSGVGTRQTRSYRELFQFIRAHQ
jgi:ribosome-associated protein